MKFKACNLKALVVLAILTFSVSGLYAQTFGTVTGRVTDPSGAVVSSASLTLTDVETNTVRNGVATDSGDYTFPSVPPGHYRVKAEVQGFKTWISQPFEVQVQQSVRLDIALQVGQSNQTVEVSGDAVLLQSENATLGTVIDNKIVTELPLNGRQYLNLVALSPNVNTLSPAAGQAGSRQGGDRASQAISTGGQRIMFDYYTLDGVNNTDPNFNTYVALPSIDAIQEFKVQIGVYPAEYGHESTQINVLTKSGTNAYHGTLFEFLRNDVLDAKQYQFTTVHPKNPFKWNDYGFELGGPVRIPHLFDGRQKLFFMSNYEGFRLRQSLQNTYSVPSPAMFTGNFGELLTLPTPIVIKDPATGTPFNGNVIPTGQLDPISLKFLQYYHSSTLPGLSNNYVQQSSQPLNRDGFVLRLDYNESPKSQWMGRYNWGDENQSNQALAGAGQKILTNYEQYAGSNTRTFSPTVVNEARFGYTRLFNSIGTLLAFNTNVVGALGIPGQNPGAPVTWGIPNVNFTGFTGIGDTNDGPYANNNNSLQFSDKLSWIHRSHAFNFGLEYDRQNYNQVGNQFSRGVFNFQTLPSNDSGYAFANFLLGNIFTSQNAVSIANAKFQRNAWAAFVDDTWKMSPKLTLSLGLRYELTPPFTDTFGNLFNVKLTAPGFTANVPQADWPVFVRQSGCTDPYDGLNIRWTITPAVCGGGLNHNLLETKYKNFAPRIGVAYALSKNTVIRSGFGIFYVQDIGNAMYFDMARNIAARVDQTWGNPATPTLTWANSIPGGSGGIAQIPPPFGLAAAYDHATSYTMQYLLNVQRQLGNDWVVELGYLGSESHHLYGFQNVNQAVPGTTGSLASRTPFGDFTAIQMVADGFNANYNAGSIRLTRHFTQGLSFNTSYTWSKSMDNSSGIRPQGFDSLYPQDSRCLKCEWAPSAFDARNRFQFGGVYDLPIGKGKLLNVNNGVANGFVSGWQLSASMTVQSGVPQTLNIGFNNSGSNTPQNDRPSYSGTGSIYAAQRTRFHWYNPAAFVVAAPGTFGDVGRNSVLTPHLQSIDFAIHKQFAMPYKEGHVLQFRLEAFNVLNHPTWGAPNANTGTSAFGTITTTAIPMRQIQLGLKYSF
ncbi:MAG TPA: TonB-dependent receptor [Terriglobales bacterium]|nr:TonB-dependent receptor [Terriglobales bacterium]